MRRRGLGDGSGMRRYLFGAQFKSCYTDIGNYGPGRSMRQFNGRS